MFREYKPRGYTSVAPYLMVDGARRLITFLEAVFDARVLRLHEMPDGSIMHVEVQIDDTVIMMSEASESYPAFPTWLHVYVPDVDETYRKAIESGSTPIQEPRVKEGEPDKRAGVRDFAGNAWWFATQLE